MGLQRFLTWVIGIILFFPLMVNAGHLIQITPTSPFPATVLASSTTNASYTVTNMASRISLTVIDKSQFPSGSGLRISSTTCGRLLAPKQSCQINLQLNASSSPQVITTELREYASPSADGVTYPIVISVISPPSRFTITPSTDGHGVISPSSPQTVAGGSTLGFTATPNSGYAVSQWYVDGVAVQTGGAGFTLNNITANHSVLVAFTLNQYTVTPSAGANGSISPSTAQTVSSGSSINFTATPNSGYSVNQWLVDGVGTQTGGTSFTLSNITANHTVQVTFSLNQYTVTPSAGANGSISPSTVQTVPSGSNISFTATPNANYEVNQWLVDGVVAQTGGTSFTLNNVTTNHTVQVTFSIIEYTVTPSAGANGSISPNTVQTVASGSSISFTAIPNLGYEVNQWLVDGVVAQTGGTGFTLSNVTANHTVNVSFTLLAIGMAAGSNLNANSAAFIAATTDGGVSWSTRPITFPDNRLQEIRAAHCTGQTTTAVCTVVGLDNRPFPPQGLLIVSQDGAETWRRVDLSGLGLVNTEFNATGGTGNGVTARNVIVGFYDANPQLPLIIASSDGGTTWANRVITNYIPALNSVASLMSVSCTGTGSTALCAAAGNVRVGLVRQYLLATSADGGDTWFQKTITGIPAMTAVDLGRVSCTGDTFCAALFTDNTQATIGVTTDGGNIWTNKALPLAAFDTLLAIDCTGAGSSAMCVAVGFKGDGSDGPLVVVSTDAGNTWSIKTVTGALTGSLNTVSCTQTDNGPICVAAGDNFGSPAAPLLIVSEDAGSTWTAKTVINAPNTGSFTQSDCSKNGIAVLCTVTGGQNDITNTPLLAVSTDLNTWRVLESEITGLPANGSFDATSTSS